MGATPTGHAAQEPSGAFANDRALVVGFNDTVSGNGWAVSPNQGQTFTRVCSFDGSATIGTCKKTPNPMVPVFAGNPPVVVPFGNWAGDPTVISDGHGNLVYVSLANTQGNGFGGRYVVAAVSTNAGASWDSSSVANFTQDGRDCLGAVNPTSSEDQPNAIFDVTTSPPTLWVVWRHAGVFDLAGACIRRGVIDTTGGVGAIRWLSDPHSVNGIGGGYTDGLAVAAGDGVVTVMYSATTTFLPGNMGACPESSGHLFSIDYGTVDSFNNGDNWSDNAQIFHSSRHQWCVIGGPAKSDPTTGQVNSGQRSFGFVRAPGGIEYAVVQDTRHSARLFMSPAAGVKGWQNPNSTIRSWFEWCPGPPTTLNVTNAPKRNWIFAGDNSEPGSLCVKGAFIDTDPAETTGLDLVFPALAVDGRGNLAVSDVEEVSAGDPASGGGPLIDYFMRFITNPQATDAKVQGPTAARLSAFSVPAPGVGGFPRPLADYTAIAVRPSRPFPTAPATLPPQPGCTTTNDFVGLWTAYQVDSSNNQNLQIIARGYSVTPP